MLRKTAIVLIALLLLSTLLFGQKTSAASEESDEPLVVATMPTLANVSQVPPKGFLQFEFGSFTSFRSSEFSYQEQSPTNLYYSLTDKLRLDAQWDGYTWQKTNGVPISGPGDARLGLKYALTPGTEHVGFAVDYHVKAPTASESAGLGTGRVDHEASLFVSRTYQKAEFALLAGYLNIGQAAAPRAHGGVGAAYAQWNATKVFNFVIEVSGMTQPWGQQEGAYTLPAVGVNIGRRAHLDAGVRFGLTSGTPRAALVADFIVGVETLRKH